MTNSVNSPPIRRQASSGIASYVPFAKWMHWTIAVLVLAMFTSGVLMKQIGGGAFADFLFSSHKVFGVVALALMVMRLAYRLFARASGIWAKASGAHPVHQSIYGLAILVPLLGWAGISDFGARTVFFGLRLPGIWPEGAGQAGLFFTAHAWLAFALIAATFLHIGVAIQDHIMRGRTITDNVG
ncbi:MAG: cytochrome b/b6 domain-containing protein [Beijerinckiaceae bacterium]|nr:cytochrome b/b6 domain-containing protein [Brevundimonas sp.]MCZ8302108.1 cytochrome b/b6 domain-containing protein [Beijerinckiaceae bacterium]